jgi:hypothetical protein
LEVGAIATATGKLFSTLQNYDIFSTVDRYQFLDPGDVHDHGAVNADEVRRIQLLRYSRNSFPKEIGVLSSIETNVVGRGFDPVNFAEVQKHHPAVCPDGQALVELGNRLLL